MCVALVFSQRSSTELFNTHDRFGVGSHPAAVSSFSYFFFQFLLYYNNILMCF